MVPQTQITEEPLDLTALTRAARRSDAGALAVFVGTVRDHANGYAVQAIDYSAYRPMAEAVLAQIVTECGTRWPEVTVLCHHRIGHLTIGDDAVIVVAAAAHRAPAFEACRYTIERIKEDCPIWKKEFGEDGAVWVSPRP